MSFVVFVIIFFVIISYVKKNASGTRNSNSVGKTSSYTQQPGAQSGAQSQQAARPQTIGGGTISAKPVSKPVAQTTSTASTASAGTGSASERTEKSTMDYLEEKAKADQLEHAKEKYAEQKRVDSVAGRKPAAGRYLIGDPIPKGCRLIECPYCAAENVVPNVYYGDKSCYFCRTHLK